MAGRFFSVRALSALCNASAMAVPPMAQIGDEIRSALRWSESASTVSRIAAPLRWKTARSRNDLRRLNSRRRIRAPSSLVAISRPPSEPEVSTTKTTSFGAGLVSFATVGAARIRNNHLPNRLIRDQNSGRHHALPSYKRAGNPSSVFILRFITNHGAISAVPFLISTL